MTLQKYLLRQLWITLALAALTMLTLARLPENWQTNGWIGTLVIFYLTGGVFFALYLKVIHKKQHTFANFFLLSTGIKMLIYILFIIIYLLFNKNEARIFLLLFLTYYAVFAVFESRMALKIQKDSGFSNSGKNHP